MLDLAISFVLKWSITSTCDRYPAGAGHMEYTGAHTAPPTLRVGPMWEIYGVYMILKMRAISGRFIEGSIS
jgi:hypothetical protein